MDVRSAVAVASFVSAGLFGCGDGDGNARREFRLPSPNMAPTFKAGDRVEAELGAYRRRRPQRGDVVILRAPAGVLEGECADPARQRTRGYPCARATPATDPEVMLIHRVAGLPGEWLSVRNNRTYIATSRDGPFARQAEPFIAAGTPCDDICNLPKPIQIPRGHYFVMGDNRGESNDSRVWGPAARGLILGKVVGKAR